MSTIRFRDLVKTAGNPEPKSLWTDPKEDRGFMQAVKQNRVITIVQEPASKKKDFGEVGFHQKPHATYFVFPKPLPNRQGKVVGIKYDLIRQPKLNDAISPGELKRKSKRARKKAVAKQSRQPVEKSYKIQVRRVAVLESSILVEARDKLEARKKVEQIIGQQDFDLSKAKIESQIKFPK
jgi:hypothetical protein